MDSKLASRYLIPIIAVLCFFPFMGSASALILGVAIAITLGNPFDTKKFVHPMLGLAVAGLGAGMNLETVAKVGLQGIGTTFLSISLVCLLGYSLMTLLKVEKEVGILITIGTAICGGSAIAAVTPVLRAKHHSVSVALGTVFILNAIALVIFPPIGHFLSMPEKSFGLWSALAIHDTSSVVGATVAYGKVAAEVGTTVKLARALWIVPVTLVLGFFVRDKSADKVNAPVKKPWFILWFLIAAAVVTWVPSLQPIGHFVELAAKRVLVLTLFLIGLGLSKETLKSVGLKPFVMGFILWILTGGISLILIQTGKLTN
jgi:uncharacterized integral membrane protein (TIGR00698 family)